VTCQFVFFSLLFTIIHVELQVWPPPLSEADGHAVWPVCAAPDTEIARLRPGQTLHIQAYARAVNGATDVHASAATVKMRQVFDVHLPMSHISKTNAMRLVDVCPSRVFSWRDNAHTRLTRLPPLYVNGDLGQDGNELAEIVIHRYLPSQVDTLFDSETGGALDCDPTCGGGGMKGALFNVRSYRCTQPCTACGDCMQGLSSPVQIVPLANTYIMDIESLGGRAVTEITKDAHRITAKLLNTRVDQLQRIYSE
jgi:hypothetical protein